MTRPHAQSNFISSKGKALLSSLIAKRKDDRASQKTKHTKSAKSTHYVTVNPADASLVIKTTRPSAAVYARRRTRSAAKMMARNYRKLFAARSLRKFVHYCYGVYQGTEPATIYSRDCEITSIHPTFSDTVARNAGGAGADVGFNPSMTPRLTEGAADRLHEWAALQAISSAKAIAGILEITGKKTLQPAHVYSFVKSMRPSDLFMQRFVFDTCFNDKERLAFAKSKMSR